MSLDLRRDAEPVPGYRLIERLGRGGFGEVWKAEGPGGFKVALKFVPLAEQVGPVELRALQIIREIRHPHLLATFGSWQSDDTLIIAMELAERTLLDRFPGDHRSGIQGDPGPRDLRAFPGRGEGDRLPEQAPPSLRGWRAARDSAPGHQAAEPAAGRRERQGGRLRPGADPGTFANWPYREPHAVVCGAGILRSEDFIPVGSIFAGGRLLPRAWGRLPFEGSLAEVMAGHVMRPPDLSMLPEEEARGSGAVLAKVPRDRWPSCRAFVHALSSEGAARHRATPIALPPSAAGSLSTPVPETRELAVEDDRDAD